MASIPSQQLLSDLEQLTRRLARLVRDNYLPLRADQLLWQASPERWSIAHNILHLNQIAVLYLSVIERRMALSTQKPAESFPLGWFGEWCLRSVRLDDQNRPLRTMRAPRAFRPDVAPIADPHAVVHQFLHDQETLMGLLQRAHGQNLHTIKIPFALFPLSLLRLRLGDMLRFLIYHHERHIVQAQKVRHDERFPS